MAEDTQIDVLSWSVFIDRLAGPLRLEPPHRQAFGLLMTLHLVAEIWGEIALLRGAQRLGQRHHFDLEGLVWGAGDSPALRTWYAGLLAASAREGFAPLPRGLLKPAWTAEGQIS